MDKMTIKILGKESRETLLYRIKTGSASGYEFKDSLTDEVPDDETLFKKSELTKYSQAYKDDNPKENQWDSLVLEIGDIPEGFDINTYCKDVCETFRNPNFVWVKDQGNGKIREYKVDGERQVLYDIHKDEMGYHLHLKTFRWSLNRETGNIAVCAMDNNKANEAQLEYTNKKLVDLGYPAIQGILKTDNSKNSPSQETKVDVISIVNNTRSIEDILKDVETSSEYSDLALNALIAKRQSELENMVQAMKQKTIELESAKEAHRLIFENRKITVELKNTKEELKASNEMIGKLKFGIENLKEIHEEELQEKDQEYRAIIGERDNSINEQNQKIGELNQELNDVFDELTNANQIIEVQNVTLKETQDLLSETKEALKEKTEFADRYKELVDIQKEQIEQSRERLREEQESFKKLQEENKKQAEALAKAIEDNKKQAEEMAKAIEYNKKQAEEMAKVVEDSKAKSVVIQTLTLENQTLVENNSKLSNIILHFSQVTAKMKSNFDGFVSSVKEKLKTSPAMQKNLNEILKGVEKKQENVYKEVSKVANEAESQNLKVDKTLIEANKPKIDLMDKNVKDDKMKPQ